MRKKLLNILIDPNTQENGTFQTYAFTLDRGEDSLTQVNDVDIKNDDDIKEGFIVNTTNNFIYPISDYVLSLLSDKDQDIPFYLNFFKKISGDTTHPYSQIIEENLTRLININEETAEGEWNREEMRYYDKDVSTQEKRDAFIEVIKQQNLPHIYLERKKYLIEPIKDAIKNKVVMEMGCGNARTIYWNMRPKDYGYQYIGTDISFARLQLAKQLLPESDFIQCSALNLPFGDNTFDNVISFGMLHHLPNHIEGIKSGLLKLKKEGEFLIHEPLEKKQQLLTTLKLEKLGDMLEGYEHSEHDNELDWEEVTGFLDNQETINVQSSQFTVSVVRGVLNIIIDKLAFIKRKDMIWNALFKIDQLVIKAFCKKPNTMGPGAVLFRLGKIK